MGKVKLFPLPLGEKAPLKGISWKKLITDGPIPAGQNVGFPLEENGCSVVDFDTGVNPAREFFHEHRELCRVIVLTRRGVHFYFSGSTKTRKFEHGDIKGNGYCVFPPSVVNGWQYKFAAGYEWGRELALFPEELFRRAAHLAGHGEQVREQIRHVVQNVRAYLAKIESIQGQYSPKGTHRSAGLVRAAAVCRDSGMTEAEAMVEMLQWNVGPTVQPPWPANEIARAVHNVFSKGGANVPSQ